MEEVALPLCQCRLPHILKVSLGFDYVASQIDGTPNEKLCEQTTFCPPDLVRYTVVGSAGVALDQVHYTT
jgi:hypothetical protein